MNVTVFVALAGAAAAVFTPLVTLIIAHRRMSGSVASSDATALWESASELRKDLLQRIGQLNARQQELEKRIEFLEAENERLHTENRKLRAIAGGSNA